MSVVVTGAEAAKRWPWWFEKQLDEAAVRAEIQTLVAEYEKDLPAEMVAVVFENPGRPLEEYSMVRRQAIERVVCRTVQAKFQEWFRGVAAWGPENEQAARASASRMREQGYL